MPLTRFESEVKTKVTQRLKGNAKEDVILKSSFKFFDPLNSGCVDKSNFCKALEKLGIFIEVKVHSQKGPRKYI
jgi:Ca2+-binding EF-hand superfamily protein